MTDNFRVAGFVTGLAIKAPCNTLSLVNIPTPTGVGGNIGGYIVGLYDRVLLTAQTDPIDNGIYSVRESAWVRDGDADGNRDFVGGTIVPVWTNGLGSVVLWMLAGDADQKTIGLSPLTFTVYYDQSAILPEIDTLLSVTTRGATTDVPIFFNPTGPAINMITVTDGGGIVLNNSTNDGFLRFRYSASDTFHADLSGLAGRFQFTGLTQSFRLLGGGGGTGPSLIFEDRAAAEPDVPGFGQVWLNNVPNPHELYFTNENGDNINLTTELWDNGTRQVLSNALGAAVRIALFIGDDDNGFGAGFGSLYIADRATPGADFASQGQFWVRDTLDGEPMFTDDQGVDSVLNAAVASAGVSGAKAFHSIAQAIVTATPTTVALNSEAYDTDTIHDNVTNNSRLTVPAGATRIRLTGYVLWVANGSATRQLSIRKNGAGGTIDDDQAGYEPTVLASAAAAGGESLGMNIDSGIIRCVATDYFEMRVEHAAGINVNIFAGDNWFQMEIIE
jgi:hypothetical protein